MKKIFVLAIALLCSFGLYAQSANDNKTETTSESQLGKNSFELLFTPFRSDGTTFNLTDFGFRYRHFFGNNALRLGLGIGFDSDKAGQKEVAKSTDSLGWVGTKDYYNKTNSTSIKISLGYERHFNITKITSLYVGGELGYKGTINTTAHWQNDSYTVTSYTDTKTTYENKADYTETDPISNTVVVALLGGVDFNVYKGLYLGLELGLKYSNTFDSSAGVSCNGTKSNSVSYEGYSKTTKVTYSGTKTTTVVTENGKTTTTEYPDHESTITYHNYESQFNFYAEPAIRIGWRF